MTTRILLIHSNTASQQPLGTRAQRRSFLLPRRTRPQAAAALRHGGRLGRLFCRLADRRPETIYPGLGPGAGSIRPAHPL